MTSWKHLPLWIVALALMGLVMFGVGPADRSARAEPTSSVRVESPRFADPPALAGRLAVAMADHDDDEDEDEPREDDGDEAEEEWEELERHMMHLRAGRMEMETFIALIEIVDEYTELVMDDDTAAVAAVLAVEDKVEELDDAVEFLEDVLGDVESNKVRRAIRLKLADGYGAMGDDEAALKHLRAVIIGKP